MVKMMGDRKLSSEQVREIRRRYAGGNTCKILAMEYGVSTATISNYVLGVKREPADRNERVSFGGDPLPSELKGAKIAAGDGAEKQEVSGADKLGGAADKQHGADKPDGGDKAVDTVRDGGAVPAECAGDTDKKNQSGAEKTVVDAGKQYGADENPSLDAKYTGGNFRYQKKAEMKSKRLNWLKKLSTLFFDTCRTQQDLARYINERTGDSLSRQAVNCWCNGKATPKLKYIPLIAEFFDVSVEYLQNDTEDKGVKTDESGADGLDACDLVTGFFMFLEKNIRGDISISILRRDGVVEIKISSKDEELMFKRRVGGSEGGGA